jgi:hypothetical protein
LIQQNNKIMISKNEQRLIDKNLKSLNRNSDDTLIEMYNENYKGRNMRREDEKAMKKALEYLLIGKI